MKTKLFLAFLSVIVTALVSNLIFWQLIRKDFEDYVQGSQEDQLYWVLAAVEGSYAGGRWDKNRLAEALHWGMMLGFDIHVQDMHNHELASSGEVLAGLDSNMRRRMESMIDLSSPRGEFEAYPLFVKGEEIGKLYVRAIKRRGNLAEKENVFRRRGREFLLISFIIAGGGAIFLSLVFSIFLTKPVRRLKEATESIARGDFGIKVDISSGDEIGKLAESFNFMSEALKREDSIRKHLASNIAHELRTPLTIMKANFEGIADGVVECSRERVEGLKEEVERLIRLVEGIEDVTRAEASFLRNDVMEEVDLAEIVGDIIMSVRDIANHRGISVTSRGSADAVVVTDREKLYSIVKNLVTNALKFTDEGEISVIYEAGKERFRIDVSDTGKGMNDEEKEHIFERYYKGRESQGTGIGLSIVKELVDSLGGEVRVESAPGKGSTFSVMIPQGTK